MRFILPIESLPHDEEQRYQLLQEYFCDQRAHSFSENGNWIVEPYWPPKLEYFIDPRIAEGFLWWDPALRSGKVYQQFRDMDGYQLSLHDTWTLYSWSKWLSKQIQGIPKELIILHVDYHNDLMSPRIAYAENQYNDLLTGNKFDIKNPESVRNAILSGAIGVGSFFVPFLHGVQKMHLRHLCEDHATEMYALKKEWSPDTLLATNQLRPTVTFQQLNEENKFEFDIYYRITSNLSEWLDNLPDAPILLHIDMDYFNCRYDGDSDWNTHSIKHDPSISEIKLKIEELFTAIIQKGLKNQIKDITIALSPGFYPAEFWEDTIKMISLFVQELRN